MSTPPKRHPGPVAGVDGCRGGWLAVLWTPDAAGLEAALGPRWRDLPLGGAAVVAVDMPIGLADRGPRACDRTARALLPAGRKSSVFAPPRRYMLTCTTWAEANAAGRAREGTGLSRQAWNLVAGIRDLDRSLAPADQGRIREAHPELVFQRLNGARPLPAKRTAEGRAVRCRLLRRTGFPDPTPLLRRFPRAAVCHDDVLDAAACALAARAMLMGTATCLPPDPPRDARGLRMEIWY